MACISSKVEFYGLYNRLQLGNMLRNWTIDEWRDIDRSGVFPVEVIAARCTTRAGALMRYDLAPEEALAWVMDACRRQGIAPGAYQLSELAPDHINTLQAEAMRTEGYLYLRYTLRSHKRMRDSLADSLHIEGLKALALLQGYMDSSSYEYTMDLFDRYPDSVLEFCCYEKRVGVLGWNTLFWEVRNY